MLMCVLLFLEALVGLNCVVDWLAAYQLVLPRKVDKYTYDRIHSPVKADLLLSICGQRFNYHISQQVLLVVGQ